MKVIGTIKAEFNGDELVNASYARGSIVQLTESEMSILGQLQNAIDGNAWDYSRLFTDLKEQDMSDAFMAVRDFVVTKYAVNNLQETIDRLDDIIMQIKKD